MIRLFLTFLNGAKPQRRWQFIMLTAFIVVSGLVELAALGGLALFITSLSSPEDIMQSKYFLMVINLFSVDAKIDTRSFYLALGTVTVALVVLKNILAAFQTYAIARFDGAFNVDYGCILLRGFLEQPYELSARENSSDLLSLLGWRLYIGSLVTHVMSLISEIVISFLLFSSLFILQPMVTFSVVVVLGIIGGGSFFFVKTRIFSLALRIRGLVLIVNKVCMKSVQGLKDVKLFNAISESVDFFGAKQSEFVRLIAVQRVFERITVWTLETAGFGGLVVGTMIMLWSTEATSAKMMGTLSLLAISAWRLLPAMYRSVAIFGYIQGYSPFLLKVQDALKKFEEFDRKEDAITQVQLPLLAQEIRLEDLSFTYSTSETVSLSEINLTIPRGSFVGVVGHSGAGKSTLAGVLTGLLVPSAGAVLVDGQALDDSSVRAWRAQVGFVPQSPYLFDGTLAENIAFTIDDERIDFTKVSMSCSLAGLNDFLDDQPDGLNVVIGERGSLLSGGQAQRVAIARALYKEPQVLIFDEATSSLDEKTERLIRETITELRGDRTIIVIAHRLKTVQDCDILVWLENGKIIDVGVPVDILPIYSKKNDRIARN